MSKGIFGRSKRGKTRKAPKRQKSPCSHRRRTFRKFLFIRHSIRLEVRERKAINLERLIQKGRNGKAPPKGNHKPFGGFT